MLAIEGKIEEYILIVLNKYGEVPFGLVKKFMPLCDEESLDADELFISCVMNLIRQKAILPVHNTNSFLRINKRVVKKEKLITALWVASEFADQIDIANSGPMTFPEQMFFVKEDKEGNLIEYDISVFGEGDEVFVKNLYFEDDIKHIIVVPDENSVERYMKCLGQTAYDYASNILFSVVTKDGVHLEPAISFYSIS